MIDSQISLHRDYSETQNSIKARLAAIIPATNTSIIKRPTNFHRAGRPSSGRPVVVVFGDVVDDFSLPAGEGSTGAPGRVSGDVGGSIGAGRLRSWHVLTRNMSIATELTTDASVKNGVQNAFQRSRRRSSLSSSRLFFGERCSTNPQSGRETTLAPSLS
jgi:hypothetical protein